MHYLYLLQSQNNGRLYIGTTANLKKRFYSHNKGLNKATKPYTPWELIYYEAYSSKGMAVNRERQLKHYGKVYSSLKQRLGLA